MWEPKQRTPSGNISAPLRSFDSASFLRIQCAPLCLGGSLSFGVGPSFGGSLSVGGSPLLKQGELDFSPAENHPQLKTGFSPGIS
jgi:hypothetical protein